MFNLTKLRPTYVVGVGMHKYQFASDTSYISMGLTATRSALQDAGVAFEAIDNSFIGTTGIGMAAGRVMFAHLGATGLGCTQVENASASGSAAFQQSVLAVASGAAEVSLALGVDKYGDQVRASNKVGLVDLSPFKSIPLIKFSILANKMMQDGVLDEYDMARVSAKNHTNASKNPYAQFRKSRTVDDILNSNRITDTFTSLMCCPRGEGAAAAVVMSEDAIKRFQVDGSKPIRVTASVSQSEGKRRGDNDPSIEVAGTVARQAYKQAGITPKDLDIIELHDAFALEEVLYTEEFGIVKAGQGSQFLREGLSNVGGECAVNPSGGLIGQGHPLGPTGLGQVHEICRQLRGLGGDRQQPDARVGMAHMIGLGTIAIAHILSRP